MAEAEREQRTEGRGGVEEETHQSLGILKTHLVAMMRICS